MATRTVIYTLGVKDSNGYFILPHKVVNESNRVISVYNNFDIRNRVAFVHLEQEGNEIVTYSNLEFMNPEIQTLSIGFKVIEGTYSAKGIAEYSKIDLLYLGLV